MIKNYIVCLFLLFYISAFPQGEANIWYFGINAGLDFNNNPPTPLLDLNTGSIFSSEGCSTISDSNGVLLFFTNGEKVWNKNHQIMLNGDDLAGHNSSTQSSAIIPYPGTYDFTKNRFNKYFLVTLDDYIVQSPSIIKKGVCYSEIDMTMDNELGSVTTNKNTHLFGTTTTEKVCVVPHSNGCDYWVICKVVDSADFYVYQISNSGFNTTPIISTTNFFVDAKPGQMKVSPNNNLLSYAVPTSSTYAGLYVFNFDNSTGLITEKFADNMVNDSQYGTAFSPNSEVLYKCSGSKIYQYDLTTTTNGAFVASKLLFTSTVSGLQSMQLAPDGKIYIARPILSSSQGGIGVINNPNILGQGCNYVPNQQSLGGKSCLAGLPNQLNNIKPHNAIIIENQDCNSLQLMMANNNNIYSYNWELAYTANPLTPISTSVDENPLFNIPNPNTAYLITCIIVSQCYSQTYKLTFTPNNFNYSTPTFTLLTNTYCQGQTPAVLPLTAENGIMGTWMPSVIDATTAGVFTYTFTPDGIQCANPINVSITIKPSISVNFTPTTICVGESLNFPNTNNISGTWFPTSVSNTSSNTYTFTPNGNCAQQTTWQVIILESFTNLTISILDSKSIVVNVENANNSILYQLDNGSFQDSNVFENVSPGCHTVNVTDSKRCTTLTSSAFVFDYPIFFTPNEDGQNDYWTIILENTKTNLYIFDRYGKLLKQIRQNEKGWDGIYNGEKLPSTDYWFVLEYEGCGFLKTFKSHFSLIR